MRTYTKEINGRLINKIPWLTASDLGKAREHLHFPKGKQRNPQQSRETEVFCVHEINGISQKCFWMQRTPATEKFFNTLIQDCRFNQHIHFNEWGDRILAVVGDGIYISQTYFFISKEEFVKFCATIVPYDEVREKYFQEVDHV